MTNQPTNDAPAPTTDDAPAVMRHAEAPYSCNVKAFDPEGFDMMFTVRDEDGGRFIERVGRLRSWLVREGFTPTRGATPANGQAADDGGWSPKPTCPTHGADAIDRSKHFEGWYCRKKLHDGTYCKFEQRD